jgi:hypothetical protein
VFATAVRPRDVRLLDDLVGMTRRRGLRDWRASGSGKCPRVGRSTRFPLEAATLWDQKDSGRRQGPVILELSGGGWVGEGARRNRIPKINRATAATIKEVYDCPVLHICALKQAALRRVSPWCRRVAPWSGGRRQWLLSVPSETVDSCDCCQGGSNRVGGCIVVILVPPA